ncbi:MAG: DegV family protein [Clostridiaceae bacterium]|nr:DegV family protein [Clostridiaceae bacterium]MDD6074854.1 DegV family protein [Clostridium sp.]
MRTAVVTDSNSGITQAQGKKLGIYVLPMPFMIDGKEYFEDITLSRKEFYERMAGDADITTSQPSPESVMGLWDRILEEYDDIVHIPMSSGLSGSCQTALMLAEEYDGRVHVVDNHRISVTQRQAVLDAKKMADRGLSGGEIAEQLRKTGPDSTIYIMVDTLKYLKKGGRITPAAAALGTLLRLKPVLTIQGEKLDAYAKARTLKQAKSMMLSAIARDLSARWGDTDGSGSCLQIAHTENEEEALLLKEELAANFPAAEIYVDALPLSIACHIGPGSLAIAATKKLDC